MEIELLNALYELKASLENDPRVLKLKELDKLLNENEEVMALSYRKDNANREYEDALRFFKENSPIVKEKQRLLYEAKYNLDIHPLVKEYNAAYKEVRLLYEEVNKELFKDFEGKKH